MYTGLGLLFLASIASARTVSLARRDVASDWTYLGCFRDSVSQRTLAYSSQRDFDVQTVETCTSWCAGRNFVYCGLEYGTECYGDYSLPDDVEAEEKDCSMACAGDSSQTCGSGDRLSVYVSGAAGSGPSTNPGPDGWAFLACYTDASDARSLRARQSVDGGMSVAQCTGACKARGYRYAGLEYADQCYCDNTIREPATVATSGCNMPCSGNSSEFCGGSNRLTVYESSDFSPPADNEPPSAWTPLGCFTDDGNARTLGTQQEVPGGYMNLTVRGCLDVCSSLGYVYGGLEYSQECFCGDAILNDGTCATDQKSCYMPCRGGTAEICGGSSRLNLYYAGLEHPSISCGGNGESTSRTTSSILSSTTSSGLTTSSRVTTPTSTRDQSTLVEPTTSSTTPSLSSTASTTSSRVDETTSPSSTLSSTTTSTSATTSIPACPTSNPTTCPSFWTSVVADLAPSMRDTKGECTDFARAAIRYAFHDAATFSNKLPFYAPAAGGADGSLLLSANEINRADNDGLHDYHATLKQKFSTYQSLGYCLSAADLIQVSGSLAVLACPGGRIGRVTVGRTDTTVEAPPNLLPEAFGPLATHDIIFQLFQDKGFSARDLAALLGAHSTSKANFQTAHGIPAGSPQDDTPGLWDIRYYNQTYFPVEGNMSRFDSDINLSNESTVVGRQFKAFVGNQGAWGASFSSAWQALGILGIPRASRAGFVDCTNVVAAPFLS
ncbi:hypothetical protein Q7P37_001674 [Cladosporium fusiforme]